MKHKTIPVIIKHFTIASKLLQESASARMFSEELMYHYVLLKPLKFHNIFPDISFTYFSNGGRVKKPEVCFAKYWD
jgi:hypothetical protein